MLSNNQPPKATEPPKVKPVVIERPTPLAVFLNKVKKDECVENDTVDFSWFKTNDEGVESLATALAQGCCKQGLEINLRGNDLSDIALIALARALESGKCPQGLKLILCYNKFFSKSASILVTALQSGKVPQDCLIDLSGNNYIGYKLIDELTSVAKEKGVQIKWAKFAELEAVYLQPPATEPSVVVTDKKEEKPRSKL